MSTDAETDNISYRFAWGDGDTSAWSSLIPSQDTVTMTHAWSDTGACIIRAIARDSRGALSTWSDGVIMRIHPPLAVPKWYFHSGSWCTAPAIGSDGTIYTSGGSSIYALRPDGSLRWELPLSARYTSEVALGPDDALCVGVEDSLKVLNADGSARWAVHLHGSGKPAVAADGTVYQAGYENDTNYLFAIDSDGSRLWRTPVDVYELPPVVAPDGTVYVGSSYTQEVTALSPDGEIRWHTEVGQVMSSGAIDADGTVYVGLHHDGGLCAVAGDGHLKWRFGSEWSFPGGVAIGPDGTLYGGEIDCDKTDGEYDIYFYAINPDGSVKWRYRMDDWDEETPAVCADGTVYFGTYEAVYALDATGRAKWYWPCEWSPGSPAVSPDGTVYIAGNGIYAFAGTSPLADSPWPKYGCDARNSSCAIGR